MMYQRSEHAVAIETLKADHENLLEETSSELKRKHEGEIQLGKVSIINNWWSNLLVIEIIIYLLICVAFILAIETHRSQMHEMKEEQEKQVI